MSDELIEEGKGRPRMGVTPELWIGVLVPPLVWALQMQINYWAVRGACVRGSNTRLYAITLVALLLILLSGVCAWLGARRSVAGERVEWGAVVSNSRFMLALGLSICAVFFIAVMAQGIAAIIFNPCQL
jgi:hypothetical protein